MPQLKKPRHPLSERHLKQIVRRPAALIGKLFSVWGMTWRPGSKRSSFLNNLYRPLGAPTLMAQASYCLGNSKEGIALAGVGAQIDPRTAFVSYDDLRLCHDLHRMPFEGARGNVLDPAEECRGTRGNASWVELALDVDVLRQRAVTRHFRLPMIPQLPQFFLGYSGRERAPFAETEELRRRAAATVAVEWKGRSLNDLYKLDKAVEQKQLAAFEQLPVEAQTSAMRTAWDSAFVSPKDASNPTGLWLLPQELSADVEGALRVFEYFGDLVGAHVFNPARTLASAEMSNPAREVAAAHGVDLAADLAVLADTVEGSPAYEAIEERIVALIPALRQKLQASESLSDQDLLEALCHYEDPVVAASPLQSLPEAQQIALMRGKLKPYISECCSDEDVLAGLRNPHGPLTASGLCQIQVLRRDPQSALGDSLQFTPSELRRERVDACLWRRRTIPRSVRNHSVSRLVAAA